MSGVSNTDKRVYLTCENKHQCPYCSKYFAQQNAVTRHINKVQCTVLREQALDDKITKIVNLSAEKLKEEFNLSAEKLEEEFNRKIADLHKMRGVSSQLNIMHLNTKDNLFDILIQQTNLPLTLTYVKNCALRRLIGDSQILQRVYLPEGKRPAIMYRDRSKTQFVYYNENNERIIETNFTVMAKKLADILYRSYLKGMSSIQTDLCHNIHGTQLKVTSDCESDAIPQVEDYDLQIWNDHIQELRDEKYQKKMLKSLNLPFENDI